MTTMRDNGVFDMSAVAVLGDRSQTGSSGLRTTTMSTTPGSLLVGTANSGIDATNADLDMMNATAPCWNSLDLGMCTSAPTSLDFDLGLVMDTGGGGGGAGRHGLGNLDLGLSLDRLGFADDLSTSTASTTAAVVIAATGSAAAAAAASAPGGSGPIAVPTRDAWRGATSADCANATRSEHAAPDLRFVDLHSNSNFAQNNNNININQNNFNINLNTNINQNSFTNFDFNHQRTGQIHGTATTAGVNHDHRQDLTLHNALIESQDWLQSWILSSQPSAVQHTDAQTMLNAWPHSHMDINVPIVAPVHMPTPALTPPQQNHNHFQQQQQYLQHQGHQQQLFKQQTRPHEQQIRSATAKPMGYTRPLTHAPLHRRRGPVKPPLSLSLPSHSQANSLASGTSATPALSGPQPAFSTLHVPMAAGHGIHGSMGVPPALWSPGIASAPAAPLNNTNHHSVFDFSSVINPNIDFGIGIQIGNSGTSTSTEQIANHHPMLNSPFISDHFNTICPGDLHSNVSQNMLTPRSLPSSFLGVSGATSVCVPASGGSIHLAVADNIPSKISAITDGLVTLSPCMTSPLNNLAMSNNARLVTSTRMVSTATTTAAIVPTSTSISTTAMAPNTTMHGSARVLFRPSTDSATSDHASVVDPKTTAHAMPALAISPQSAMSTHTASPNAEKNAQGLTKSMGANATMTVKGEGDNVLVKENVTDDGQIIDANEDGDDVNQSTGSMKMSKGTRRAPIRINPASSNRTAVHANNKMNCQVNGSSRFVYDSVEKNQCSTNDTSNAAPKQLLNDQDQDDRAVVEGGMGNDNSVMETTEEPREGSNKNHSKRRKAPTLNELTCPDCGTVFARLSALRSHERMHAASTRAQAEAAAAESQARASVFLGMPFVGAGLGARSGDGGGMAVDGSANMGLSMHQANGGAAAPFNGHFGYAHAQMDQHHRQWVHQMSMTMQQTPSAKKSRHRTPVEPHAIKFKARCFVCGVCSASFIRRQDLRRHEATKHTAVKFADGADAAYDPVDAEATHTDDGHCNHPANAHHATVNADVAMPMPPKHDASPAAIMSPAGLALGRIIACPDCRRLFSRTDALYRHRKGRCKGTPVVSTAASKQPRPARPAITKRKKGNIKDTNDDNVDGDSDTPSSSLLCA